TPAFAALKRALGAAGEGTAWRLFAAVETNPAERDVAAAAAAFREGGCDGVVAFGGGSALDAGKAARLLVKRPATRLAAFDASADWSGLAPCVCVPTTAGTGSEVGRSSVIVPAGSKAKAVVFHPRLLADLVILDPELTVGLPPRLTAATGADALTHCIESFTCPVFHPPCDGIALEGIHLIVDALPRAFRNGGDLDARGRMLVAAAMGAIAFQKDLGAAHSLAHPLSALCGVHHGTANALVLPAVMRFNAARAPGLYRRVAAACGRDVARAADAAADREAVEFTARFQAELGLGTGLTAAGVKADQLDALADMAFADPCHRTNAVPTTRADLLALYRECL
ncbi:MAG: iron-containing alcohol dehydrogenase, partial [bacterium]